jgi:hypothetical protein
MTLLTDSVGRLGRNLPPDVKTVQSLLNRNRPAPLRPIAEDGRIGSETIGAIEEFQRRVVKFPNPDGRVDPGGRTWQALTSGAPTPVPGPVLPKLPVTVTFRHGNKQPTGVTGLPGANDKTTATRYESAVLVAGGVTGSFRGSIYPDNLNVKGRLKDGEYDIYLGFHKPGVPKAEDLAARTNGMRAALIVNANGPVPVVSNAATKVTSEAIHIHNGYNTWKAEQPMSEGCLILAPGDWPKFIKLFLDAYPDLADWTAGGGRLGKKIGKVIVQA